MVKMKPIIVRDEPSRKVRSDFLVCHNHSFFALHLMISGSFSFQIKKVQLLLFPMVMYYLKYILLFF